MDTRILDNSVLNIGKIPPHDLEIERSVIGALLWIKDSPSYVIPLLSPECFYKEENKVIYEAIANVFKKGINISLVTIGKELRESGNLEKAGGVYAITQFTNYANNTNFPNTESIELQARWLQQYKVSRDLIQIFHNTIPKAYEIGNDPFELINEVNKEMALSMGIINSNKPTTAKEVLSGHLRELDKVKENPGLFCIESLDNITKGAEKGDLIIVAGRPSMGKTAFALSILIQCCLRGRQCGLISIEMNKNQIMNRIITNQTLVPYTALKQHNLSDWHYQQIYNLNPGLLENLIIDDDTGIDLLVLQSKLRYMKSVKPDLEFVAIDYLQIMKVGKHQTRDREIAETTRGIKLLAKDLGIMIILLSQLNRAVEGRGDKIPQLSDLRESGAIEQDADMVIFPFRPEVYSKNPESDSIEINGEYHSIKGLALYVVAKNRNGATGIGVGKFIGEKAKYE